ncbi:MAG: hypothetical protein AAF639_42130 [Chloroflexota bacterium]
MNKFANTVLSIVAALSLLVCVYLLYKQLNGNPTPIILYAAGIGFALLMVAAQRLHVNIKMNLVMMMISVGFMLYAVEAFLVVWGNPLDFRTERFQVAMAEGIRYDVRTPLEVTADAQAQGEDAYPFVAPSNFVVDFDSPSFVTDTLHLDGNPAHALTSIANVTTIYCNESGDYIRYQSDPYGLRNPPDVWTHEQQDIVTLGDSFTQGACVDDETMFVSQIRQQYPKTLNLGINGSGPLSQLAMLKEYGATYQPSTVLWFYFEGNDLGNLMSELENPILTRYFDDDYAQNLSDYQNEIDAHRKHYVGALMAGIEQGKRQEWLNAVRLFQVRRLLRITREPTPTQTGYERYFHEIADATGNTIIEKDPLFDDGLPVFLDLMRHAQSYVSSWGGEIIFVYLPDYQRFAGDEPLLEESLYRLEILRRVEELNLSLIDLYPHFVAHGDPLALFPFRLNGHYNEEGNRLVADAVLEYLSERK